MATRILTRHLQPGDVVVISGKTQTISAVNCDGGSVHLYIPGHPAEPYAFSDSSLITIVTRDGRPIPGTATVPESALTDQELGYLEVFSQVPRGERVRLIVESRTNPA